MAGDKTLGLYWGAAAGACAALLPFAPAAAPLAPPCLFRSLTGLPCPTCGATHAVVALSHLDFGAALIANPLVTGAVLVFLLGGLAAGVAALARRPLPEPATWGAAPRWAAIAAVGANWAWVVLHAR